MLHFFYAKILKIMSKTDADIKDKLFSKDSKIRKMEIEQTAKSGSSKQLALLMNLLVKQRLGNGLPVAIKAIGNSHNGHGKEGLINIYGQVNTIEKKLIIESLLKLGAFKDFFDGNHIHKNVSEQLWALLFSANSNKLRQLLALEPEEFQAELDFARKATKHWRNKKDNS